MFNHKKKSPNSKPMHLICMITAIRMMIISTVLVNLIVPLFYYLRCQYIVLEEQIYRTKGQVTTRLICILVFYLHSVYAVETLHIVYSNVVCFSQSIISIVSKYFKSVC